MCIDALWRTSTNRSYVALFATPYESQVRLIFGRMNELIDMSPALLKQVESRTKTPFSIKFKNGSRIIGFTTGASSGGGAASARGQRADAIYLDESDYMSDADFDSILMIAGERDDIPVFLSSTPTGARKRFWKCCTDRNMHFREFHFPSMCNPNWSAKMEEEFRAQLSEAGYTHEVLAEFGEQETGVFNKDKLDAAMKMEMYAYDELTYSQQSNAKANKWKVEDYRPPSAFNGTFRPNVFRTLGVDWDKYQASSSLLILDYDIRKGKFKVIRRIEVPKVQYSFDAAVNLVIEMNRIYNPSFIYVDRGSGEYQIEKLHLYGEENPESGLLNKVKGFQFSQTLDIMDPVKKTITKEPMKPFMINQLTMAFEREKIMLSPFDETLHKQLVDYEVKRIGTNGRPIFTDVNEHFVDALGLAFLAFALEFPDITKTIKKIEHKATIIPSSVQIGQERVQAAIKSVQNMFNAVNPWGNLKNGSMNTEKCKDPCEVDKPKWFKVDMPARSPFRRNSSGWGSRSPSGGMGRSMW